MTSFQMSDVNIDLKTKALAEAIAYSGEGLGTVLGHVQLETNNPGDLELGDRGLGTLSGKTIFPSLSNGWTALYDQCSLYRLNLSKHVKRLMTFYEFADVYTGKENSKSWAERVAQRLGVDPNTTLDSYFE